MTDPEIKKRKPLIGALQIATILGFVFLAVVLARAPTEEKNVNASSAQVAGAASIPALLVRVLQPPTGAHLMTVGATGTIVVRNNIDLTPQVTGRVQSVSNALRSGGRFSAQETLLSIDPRDFELAIAQAEADVASAQSSLMLKVAESDAAKSNYAILNPGLDVPPLVARTPQIEQAKASLASARARADIAALDLTRTSFSLPFEGRVVASSAEIGQLLSKGQSFGTVFAIDSVEAVIPISPTDLAAIMPAIGRRVTLFATGNSFEATIARVSSILDERSRFAQLYLSIRDRANLVPGTFVDAQIEGPKHTDTFLLPTSAEQINGLVWVVNNDQLEEVQTEPIGRIAEGIIVPKFDTKDGLVIGAIPGGRPGLRVTVVPPTMQDAPAHE